MKVADNKLADAQLSKFAKRVTRFRKIQRQRALEVSEGFDIEQAEKYLKTTERLARKMHSGFFW